jgi:hypothetical protein
MGFADLNLGQIATALSMTGGDDDLVEELKRRDAEHAMREQEQEPEPDYHGTVDVGPIVMGGHSAPTGMDELPPKAAAALEAYQNLEPRAAVSGNRRTLADDNAEPGELGVAPTPKFDPGPVHDEHERSLPPETQQALEATGSNYRLPENPNPELISQKDYNGRASQRTLRNEHDQGTNELMDLQTERGEIASEGAQKLAQSYGEKHDALHQETSAAREQVDQNRTKKDSYEAQAQARLDAMAERMANPPKDTFQTVLGIVGAVMAMKGNKGAAAGMQMLGQAMGSKAQAWQQAIATDHAMAGELMKMAKFQNDDSESELGQARALSGLVAGEFEASLKQVEAEAGSEEGVRAAQELRLGVRQKALEHQMALNDQAAQQSAAAAEKNAAARKAEGQLAEDTAIMRALQQVPEDERPSVAASYGPRAIKLLEDMQKPLETQAEIAGKRATAAKTAADAAAGPDGGKLTDGDKKLQRLAEGVRPAYDSLSKLAGKIASGEASIPYVGIGPKGSEILADEETQNLNQNILQLANVLLRDETGANMPPDEQDTKWKAWGLLSPDAAVRNRGLGKMLAEFQGRVAHVAPVGAAKQQTKIEAPAPYTTEQIQAEIARRRAQASR